MTDASDSVRYLDDGDGPPILVLPGGMNDPSNWAKVTDRLVQRLRVVRLDRRQYRLDLDVDRPITLADEVDDVLILTGQIGRPVLIVGHSSGAVVALEAMVAAPERFAGAVLYEPPLVIGPPLGGDALVAARAADQAGKRGKALGIFLRDIVQMPWWVSPLARVGVSMSPRLRRLVPRQLDDVAAIDALGVRLDAYAGVDVPTVFLRGERSPQHLAERTAAVAAVMPDVRRIAVIPGQGHTANDGAPDQVAAVIAELADEVFR